MIDYCFSLFLEVTILVVILHLGLMIFLNVPSPGNPEVIRGRVGMCLDLPSSGVACARTPVGSSGRGQRTGHP